MFRAIELKRNRLVNGHGDGLGRGVAVVAGVNGNRLSLHRLTNPTAKFMRRLIRESGILNETGENERREPQVEELPSRTPLILSSSLLSQRELMPARWPAILQGLA